MLLVTIDTELDISEIMGAFPAAFIAAKLDFCFGLGFLHNLE